MSDVLGSSKIGVLRATCQRPRSVVNTYRGGADVAQRICSVEGCGKPAFGRGWCKMHHTRWLRTGDLNSGIKPAIERFWARVQKTDTCWLWIGFVNNQGYGTFASSGTKLYAHRWSYERFVGPIPEGLTIDHLCRVTRCVRPDHLEPVSHAENIRRAARTITHCPHGHPYDETNTRIRTGGGGRLCRECGRQCVRRAAARRIEAEHV